MTAQERAWQSTGFSQHAPGDVDRIPEFDSRTGDHLWIVITSYRVNPALMSDPTHTPMLDTENLVSVTGPGCFYCEQPYSPRLGSRRCKGRP
jgi:hypothetical protein